MTQLQKVIRDSQGLWKTESDFFVWLRGSLRRIWARHPIKNTYKTSKRYPITKDLKANFNSKVKFLINCELCQTPTVASKVEVDHKTDAGSLKSLEDVLQFIYRLLFISWEDIRCLCKDCHKIVTLASRLGLTFEEAKLEKQVIAFSKKPAAEQVAELRALGFAVNGNVKYRKEYYRKYLKELHERS